MAKHPNRLSKESSPYLLQHSHNPVDWYPWGEEALQRAREEQKPILVSIGYSACHWCHVMEHESFEDEAVAEIMNHNFINIKIDREERPDLDHIYMEAVQVISGSGGWPLNVFLTPDAKPFFGGTYFPPKKAFNRASWPDVLNFISRTWLEKKDEILKQADILTQHISNSGTQMMRMGNITEAGEFNPSHLESIKENLMRNADLTFGGFGAAPKFPQTMSIQYILMYDHFFSDPKAKLHALNSIKQMCRGGLYDHLAGGFARYSTDSKWLAPHFEKMLYDNALLIRLMCDAFQRTRDKFYEQYILHTIDFLQSEMKSKEGGYYAALDADSEGVEGKFYTWSKAEFDEILGEDASLAARWFGVTDAGNWESVNILHLPSELENFISENKLNEDQFKSKLTTWTKRLIERRNTRVRPGTDDKILLGWNALLVSAFCSAYSVLGKESLKEESESLMGFLLTAFENGDGSYSHTYKDGKARYPGFLDDYAFLIRACIELQEITSDQKYLEKAELLTRYVIDNFSDENGVMFFFTGKSQNDVIVRKMDIHDGALPSGNSIMAGNLVYLSIVFDQPLWSERASIMTSAVKDVVVKYPTSFGEWAMVILKQVVEIEEIVITGSQIEAELKKLLRIYFPNKVLQSHTTPIQSALLKGKAFNEPHWIYKCKNYSCGLPVRRVEELGLMGD